MIPVGISILRDELPEERLGSGVALMSAALGTGSAIGLPLAGLLSECLGWTSIFWISAAAGTLMLSAVWLVVPESGIRRAKGFDYGGALILSAALVGLLLAISKAGSLGWNSEPVLLLVLAAAVLITAWVPYELTSDRPMVDLRVSARRPVLPTNLATLLIGFAMFMNMLLTTQQLQIPLTSSQGFGLTASAAGLCMLPASLAMLLIAPVSSWLIFRLGARTALLAGAAVMFVGYVVRVFFYDSVAVVITGSTVVSVGTALAYAAIPTLLMGAVPRTETASAIGLNSLLRCIGTSISGVTVGASLAQGATTVGSITTPSLSAFQTVFWMAAGASAASAAAALFIPRSTQAHHGTGRVSASGQVQTPPPSPR